MNVITFKDVMLLISHRE